jgi:hypothetical protein
MSCPFFVGEGQMLTTHTNMGALLFFMGFPPSSSSSSLHLYW